jgi:ABC-type dipeptide/oligopeptide/nickel transport system permease subunit
MKRTKSGALRTFSAAVLVMLLISAAFPALLAPADPASQDLDSRFSPPFSAGHLLGTDSLGRDVLSRLVYGGRSALVVGLVSCSVALLIGFAVALPAAFGPRWLESSLMLLMDGLLAIPTILLAVAIVAVFGYGLVQVMLAMGIVFSPLIARLLKAELQRAWRQDYVEAELLLNRPAVSVFFAIALPQILGPLLVQLTSLFAASITIEASLSFLGIGIQPPQSSWGIMLNNARDYLISAPWLAFSPGIALALTVYSLNVIGDEISDSIRHH